jgi:hypothetical protein
MIAPGRFQVLSKVSSFRETPGAGPAGPGDSPPDSDSSSPGAPRAAAGAAGMTHWPG